jgi:hypothetical protein
MNCFCVKEEDVTSPEPIQYKPVDIIYAKPPVLEKKLSGMDLYRQYANLPCVKKSLSNSPTTTYRTSPTTSSCSPSPAQHGRSIEEVKQQREVLANNEQPLLTDASVPTKKQRTILESLKEDI